MAEPCSKLAAAKLSLAALRAADRAVAGTCEATFVRPGHAQLYSRGRDWQSRP